MSDSNNKKNNPKTINFAERKKALTNKQAQQSTPKNPFNDNRVIQYDINKMREQINQQTRNKKKLAVQGTSYLIKFFYGVVVTIFVVLMAGKLTNNFGNSTSNEMPSKFVTQSTSVSNESTIEYERLIDENIKQLVKSDGDLEIVTSSIHKNASVIFASGYFTYPGESNKIYFDAKLSSNRVVSLVVNGFDLIKK